MHNHLRSLVAGLPRLCTPQLLPPHTPLPIAEIPATLSHITSYRFHLTARISAAFLALFCILQQVAIPPLLYLLTNSPLINTIIPSCKT